MNWRFIRIIDTFLGIPLIRLIWILKKARQVKSPPPPDIAPRKILLLKFWGIGNIFMMLPSIQALHDAYPEARIDLLTLENNREAVRTLSVINHVTAIDTGSVLKFFRSWRSVLTDLTATRYDLAIDFDQFARFSALMTHQTGAIRTIGFSTRGQHRHQLYSRAVEYDDHMHVARSFHTLVATVVNRPFSADVRFINVADLRARGLRLLHEQGIAQQEPLVVMHIGTSHNFKERRWSPANYAALADLLADRFGMRTILTGLPDEAILIAEAKHNLRRPERVIDLCGQLTFHDFFALIAVADLVISADTATVHIASAVNTPAVGFYGPNSPSLYGPWRENSLALYTGFVCSPCITNFNGKINTCRHPEGRGACMNSVTLEAAFQAISDRYLLCDAPWLLGKLKGATA